VPAAAYGYEQIVFARKPYALNDVGGLDAPCNHRGTLVDHRVPHSARSVVAPIAWAKQRATEACLQLFKPGLIDDDAGVLS
jgi:hypothetical protein